MASTSPAGDGYWHGPGTETPTLEGLSLRFTDDDYLEFGNLAGGDAEIGWDGTNLVLKPAVDDTGAFHIGNGTLDFDMKWFAGTTAKYALFDMGAALLTLEDVDLHLGDNDQAEFGDASGGDANLKWDATNLVLVPSADNTGAFQIGNGTLNFSAVTLGAQASVAGSGMTMSATNAAGFAVFTDDGNASISSGTLTRAGRFRNLQVYTAGNREQEAAGLIGQLVSIAGTNRHNMCGLMGSYEAGTSLTVDGQAAATDTWAQAAVIGRVGVGSAITTLNADGVLAGFAAMSNTASFVANNGVFAAFYAGAWASALDWAYGLYLEAGKVDVGIKMTPENQGIDSVVTALAAAGIGHSFYVTVSAPNNQSGMAAYFDATINGSTAGHCYGLGSWINTGPTSPVLSAGHIIVPFEGGVYTGEAQASARVVFGGQHQAILDGAPASLHCWRLNTTQTITALIAAANTGSVGYAAAAGATSNKLGDIPLAEIVGINGGNPVYIRVYDAAG